MSEDNMGSTPSPEDRAPDDAYYLSEADQMVRTQMSGLSPESDEFKIKVREVAARLREVSEAIDARETSHLNQPPKFTEKPEPDNPA